MADQIVISITGKDELTPKIKDVEKSLNNMGDSASSQGGKFSSLQEIARGALHSIGGMAVDAGKALLGIGVDAVKMAGDFQSSMNTFGAASGLAGEDLMEFQKLFIDIGKELPVSTEETVAAATALVKGGLDPAVLAAGGLKDALNFAAAGAMELEEAANIAANSVGQFIPATADAATKAAFMAQSMDLMTKAANASTLDVADLALGMAEAGGTVKAIGMDYADFATVMGALAPSFSSASTAGTSLKNMLTRLQPSTKPAYEAMQELGLVTPSTTKMLDFLAVNGVKPVGESFEELDKQVRGFLKESQGLKNGEIDRAMSTMTDNAFFANGELLSMQEIVGTLEVATRDLNDEQKISYMNTIFGSDAMGAAVALAEMGVEGYDAFAETMEKANGVQEQAAAVQQGFNYEMDQIKATLEASQLAFGMFMMEALTPYLPLVGQAVDYTSSLVDAFIAGFPQIKAQVVEMSSALSIFAPIVDSIIKLSLDLFAAFTGSEAQGAASGLAGVVGMIIDILGGLWKTLQSTLTAVINALSPIVARIVQFVMQIVTAISTTLQSPEMKSAFDQFNLLFATAGIIIQQLVEIISEVLIFTLDKLKITFEFLWPVIDFILKQIILIVSLAISIMTKILNSLIMVLDGDFAGAWRNIQQTISTAWTAIKTAVQTGIDGVKAAFKTFIDSAGQIGLDIVAGIAKGISSGAGQIADAAKSAASNAFNAAKALLGISSPSKLFADSIGMPISQGIAAGIAKGAPEINGALNATLGGASAGTTQTVQNYYLSATYNTRQSESSIMADLRAMQLLSGAV